MQLVDGLHRRVHRRIKTKCRHRARDVVVDGFWHANDAHPFGLQLRGDFERAIAADRDDRFDAEVARILDEFVGAINLQP